MQHLKIYYLAQRILWWKHQRKCLSWPLTNQYLKGGFFRFLPSIQLICSHRQVKLNQVYKWCSVYHNIPDSKVHGANMGPTWVLSAPDGPHVGPINLAIRGGCMVTLMWHITHSMEHIWVRSQRFSCLVTWFCYQLIAKPGNKRVAPSWPEPYGFVSLCWVCGADPFTTISVRFTSLALGKSQDCPNAN